MGGTNYNKTHAVGANHYNVCAVPEITHTNPMDAYGKLQCGGDIKSKIFKGK